MLAQTKTDNSYLQSKVELRLQCLPDKKTIYVLDCFHGYGKVWDIIKTKTNKKIKVLGIDKKQTKITTLKGDNLKWLESIDLSVFDIIDLDAYGVPFKQLEIIFNKNLKGKIIFITFIQSMFGCLPTGMLNKIGIKTAFINKCPSLFYKNGFNKFLNYLSLYNVAEIDYTNIKNKYYGCFKI